MGRIFTIIFHVIAMIFAGLNFEDGVAALNLEEQVQLLQDKYEQLGAKVIYLEGRVQQHAILVEKIAQLELVLMEKERLTGKVAVNGMPTSCQDLWLIGHNLNGLYSVMGADKVESVYCDFTKLSNEPGFQTWIGFIDIQSSPTYFYVQRNRYFEEVGIPIPYEIEKLNVGGAMNLQTGKFTAPRKGTYFFSFSGIASIPSSSGPKSILHFNLNGENIVSSHAFAFPGSTITFAAFNTMHSILALQAGDQVWVNIRLKSEGGTLYDDEYNNEHYTQFIGWLLQEDISH